MGQFCYSLLTLCCSSVDFFLFLFLDSCCSSVQDPCQFAWWVLRYEILYGHIYVFSVWILKYLFLPPQLDNNVCVHDLLTFQLMTTISKAKGASLLSCDLQVRRNKSLKTFIFFLNRIHWKSHNISFISTFHPYSQIIYYNAVYGNKRCGLHKPWSL